MTENPEDRAAFDFMIKRSEDQARGIERGLAEYIEMFSGHAERIAREYLADIDDAESSNGSEASTVASPPHKRVPYESTTELRIGPYLLVRILGSGSQGQVWLAKSDTLNRSVALKVMSRRTAFSESARQRFEREAVITSKIDHRGICTIYDAGEDRGNLYIAMRYLDGESLQQRLSTMRGGAARGESKQAPSGSNSTTRPVTVSRKAQNTSEVDRSAIDSMVRLIKETAEALQAAHDAGLIHRDIKPGNIMIARDSRPVILDFGIARDDQADAQTLTNTGDIIGTPSYMSPEQLRASRVDFTTDIYSLGATLYECLTLRPPFVEATRQQLFQAIDTKEPEDPRRHNKKIGEDLAVCVMTALDKDQDRRYRTAQDFADDLGRILTREPIQVRPIGPLIRTKRWIDRNRSLAASLALAFFFLSSGLIASLAFLQKARTAESTAESNARRAAASAKRANKNERLAARQREQLRAERDEKDQALRELQSSIEREAKERRKGVILEERVASAKSSEEEIRSRKRESDRSIRLFDMADRLEAHLSSVDEILSTSGYETEKKEAWLTKAAELRSEARNAGPRSLPDGDPKGPHGEQVKKRRWAIIRIWEARRELSSCIERVATAASIERRELGRLVNEDRAAWAAEALESKKTEHRKIYGNFALPPQPGLFPLGRCPSSGLNEYLHLRTHATDLPERGESRVGVSEESGVIFVLIPGGSFWMGAQSTDPEKPNYCRFALEHESPVHRVALEPFLISKYELTNAQRARALGRSFKDQADSSATLPSGSMSWLDCRQLAGSGLVLPTEAQWEYAARGGTTTPWWVGTDPFALAGAEKVSGHRSFGARGVLPVGSLKPNGFGLHDVLGNLREWVRDDYLGYKVDVANDDGLRTGWGSELVILRAGSFATLPRKARASGRHPVARSDGRRSHGFRPSRILWRAP